MTSPVKRRAEKAAITAIVLIAAGLLYATVICLTGYAVPCLFREVTGLLCPGCGITHMCLALMRLDFAEAWRANRFLFVLSPAIVGLILYNAICWIRTGSNCSQKGFSLIGKAFVVSLVIWGIVRNMLGI